MTVRGPGSLLSFAGVDLIRESSGSWRVLEVNDHPIGLLRADALANALGSNAFGGGGIVQLANLLVRGAGAGAVCLLLPECFRLQSGCGVVEAVARAADNELDDARIESTLREFNAIACTVRTARQCFVCDELAFTHRHGRVFINGGSEVGSIYLRSSAFPHDATNCAIVNDIRSRLVCGDKLLSSQILSACLGENGPPETLPFVARADILESLRAWGARHQWVIVKPRWGSASMGVERLPLEEVCDHFESRIGETHNAVVQPWLAPDVLPSARGMFCYDVRIFVVDGKPAGGFARRAAAPNAGVAAQTKLAWLTTTGPQLPIRKHVPDGQTVSVESISLSQEELDKVCRTACAAVSALDSAATKVAASELEQIPSFAELNGARDEIRTVWLRSIPQTPS